MRKLLWIGDADVATGFARCTHHILDVLRKSWDVSVLGLNYQGDPHKWPYPIYPCWPGGDLFGVRRVPELLAKIEPDLVVVQNDPWNIPEYLMQTKDVPVVASMPVDGKNCQGGKLNGLSLAVFWTQFGLEEARLGGYEKPAVVIPLGVDLEVYQPMDRKTARRKIGLPPEMADAFIVGNINRNQPRKRLDLTIKCFAEWVHATAAEDAYLYLHIAPTAENSYEVHQLMQYYGFRGEQKRLIIAQPEIGHGVPESELATVYSCFDVQLTTTQGEGWGLTTMEGMACGIPQIVPDWAALGEWTEDAALRVECDHTATTLNGVNVVGGLLNTEACVKALKLLYMSRSWPDDEPGWAQCRQRGLQLVQRSEYRWKSIGERFAEALEPVCVSGAKKPLPKPEPPPLRDIREGQLHA